MNSKDSEISPFFEPSYVESVSKERIRKMLEAFSLRSCENCSLVMSKEELDHSPEDCIVSEIMTT